MTGSDRPMALVTGAGGFLGRAVTARLAPAWRIRALAAPGQALSPGPSVDEVVHADVSRPGALTEACRGVDLVVHLAAMYVFGPADPTRMWQVNVEGTREVLRAAGDVGAVVVHVSSASALGRTGPTPEDETFWGPLVAPTMYESTKREAHLRALQAAAEGVRVRIAAPTGIYGQGDTSTAGKLMETLVRRPPPVFGPADVVQCPVDVRDCADALARIADAGRDGELYCVAGAPVTMLDWAGLVCETAGHSRPRGVSAAVVRRATPVLCALAPLGGMSRASAREMLTVGVAHYAYSAAKLERETGWSARPLRAGVEDLVSSVRGAGG